MYTTNQKFRASKILTPKIKLIILLSKDTLNRSQMTLKKCIILQIYIILDILSTKSYYDF